MNQPIGRAFKFTLEPHEAAVIERIARRSGRSCEETMKTIFRSRHFTLASTLASKIDWLSLAHGTLNEMSAAIIQDLDELQAVLTGTARQTENAMSFRTNS